MDKEQKAALPSAVALLRIKTKEDVDFQIALANGRMGSMLGSVFGGGGSGQETGSVPVKSRDPRGEGNQSRAVTDNKAQREVEVGRTNYR